MPEPVFSHRKVLVRIVKPYPGARNHVYTGQIVGYDGNFITIDGCVIHFGEASVDDPAGGLTTSARAMRWIAVERVEYIRELGFAYSDLERMGVGLPVTDLSVTYRAPALYDDIVSVEVGLAKLSFARLHFAYRLRVEPGDRHGFTGPAPIDILYAQTFHGCMDMQEHRATRLPEPVYDILEAHVNANTSANTSAKGHETHD